MGISCMAQEIQTGALYQPRGVGWGGRGEERMRCMERVTWKLTLPYVKQIAKEKLLYDSENSNRSSVST